MKPFKAQKGPVGQDLLEDGGELAEVLCEFDAVIEDFSSPIKERHFQYEEHLEQMKRRSSTSISDSESADSLCGNSLSFSDEKLHSPTPSTPSVSSPTIASRKAKLGDTKELEDFIADLDRVLAKKPSDAPKKPRLLQEVLEGPEVFTFQIIKQPQSHVNSKRITPEEA